MYKIFLILSLILILTGNVFASGTLEDLLANQINAMKGIKMVDVTFSIENKKITAATVTIRPEPGFAVKDEEKNAIMDFVLYSTSDLKAENITVNITKDPVIASPGVVKHNVSQLEKDICGAIKKSLPVLDVYVNIITSKKNFLGGLEVTPKAAIILKITNNYKLEEKELFSVVDFLCKSVKDLSMDNILIIDHYGYILFQVVK